MKIYEVQYNNGEEWEDACYFSEKFFTTEKKAIAYVKALGLVEVPDPAAYGGTLWQDPNRESWDNSFRIIIPRDVE